MSITVGVRELRNNLRAVLARVKDGEEVLVTEHGRTVARISPPDRTREELIAAGIITPARRPKTKIDVADLIVARGNVSDYVSKQRR